MSNSRRWIILGATSIIAEQFAHIAALNKYSLRLVGRDEEQLRLISQDLVLRYQIPCDTVSIDMREDADSLLAVFDNINCEYDLFIAHSEFTENADLNSVSITNLIKVNLLSTTILINAYLNNGQKKHHLVYLSSVAACRGRAKNSLYGGTKAAIEVYLEGLQQTANPSCSITIARLGFIDTKQTYGLSGIFYAAHPRDCAKACWKAVNKGKRVFYYPSFWRIIMAIMQRVPFLIYKKMGSM